MKEMNLEEQLRSWRPRRPSPAVKTRLFPNHARRRELAWLIRWLAPTAACGLIALVALHDDGFFRELSSSTGTAGHQVKGNIINIGGVTINRSPDFFEWTNRSGSAFNVRSFLPGTTN